MSEQSLREQIGMPAPIWSDNFDLHRVDCTGNTALVLAPGLRGLVVALESFSWVENKPEPVVEAFGVARTYPHTLKLVFTDLNHEQEVLDARAALTEQLDAIVFCLYDEAGSPARYIMFSDVITETVKSKLSSPGTRTKVAAKKIVMNMRFKTVKESKEHPAPI